MNCVNDVNQSGDSKGRDILLGVDKAKKGWERDIDLFEDRKGPEYILGDGREE